MDQTRLNIPNAYESKSYANDTEGIDYNQVASGYAMRAMILWCLTGWIYAAITWRVLILPGLLIFFPGVFVASAIAAMFFIPIWVITNKYRGTLGNIVLELESSGKFDGADPADVEAIARSTLAQKKNIIWWANLGILLRIGGFFSPIFAAIAYVHLLRYLLG